MVVVQNCNSKGHGWERDEKSCVRVDIKVIKPGTYKQ